MKGFINNDHDRANLNFLIQNDPMVVSNWFKTASDDDLIYATELLRAYDREMREETFVFTIEEQLEKMDGDYPLVNDLLRKVKPL